jgi:aspartate/methionine/tyrosine aminotransferase
VTRFAQRTNWNTERSPLSEAIAQRLAAGLPLLDLTASNPTRAGFAYAVGLPDALTNPIALDYNPDPCGMLTARQAVADYYNRAILPEQVLLTVSTSEAYSFLFRLLCDPGDEVLIAQPGYPLFDYLADLNDIHLRPFPLVYDHGWQLDPEALRQTITPRTRAIVLVHPNNPTGHYLKRWERQQLETLCLEHELSLIVDEVFLDYALRDEARQPSFAEVDSSVPVFVLSGLSKICGLPQMKAAWIVCCGAGIEPSLERLEIIADTYLSMNAPIQLALPQWLAGRDGIQRQIRERVASNLAELDRQLAAQQMASRLEVEGGWYALLRIPALGRDEDFCLRLIQEAGVSVHPGYFFGMEESGWLVLSLLTPEKDFAQGVMQIIRLTDGAKPGCLLP